MGTLWLIDLEEFKSDRKTDRQNTGLLYGVMDAAAAAAPSLLYPERYPRILGVQLCVALV